MYHVIGADKAEYGPLDIGRLRAWIAEGRLDAGSLVRAGNETQWRPLAAFPELADAFSRAAPLGDSMLLKMSHRMAALQAVKHPATCLLISALLNTLFGALAIFGWLAVGGAGELMAAFRLGVAGVSPNYPGSPLWLLLVLGSYALVVGVTGVFAARCMRKLRGRTLCVTACILTLIPCATPGWCLGLPFGFWALDTLRQPVVRESFTS